MNEALTHYLGHIVGEAKKSSVADFNLAAFDAFSSFDLVNFHLLYRHILENGKDDFFIRMPETEFGEHFYESIFYAVVSVKLFQNFCAYKEAAPALVVDDILYRGNRLYRYLGRSDNRLKVAPLFPDKNQKDAVLELPAGVFTKLNPRFDYRKEVTIKSLQGYAEFLQRCFRSPSFPFLTEFVHKTLIVSEKKVTRINTCIPFRYHSRKGTDAYQLPLQPMIDICTSYEAAEQYILNQDEPVVFDELIVIGHSKYQEDTFPAIQQGKWREKFRSLILIGSEPPSCNHPFRQFRWTKREVLLAGNRIPAEPTPQVVADVPLREAILHLRDHLHSLKEQHRIDLVYLLKFANFYLRQLTGPPAAASVLEAYRSRIEAHLATKDVQDLLLDRLGYSPEKHDSVRDHLLHCFDRIGDCLRQQNNKWEAVVALARIHPTITLLAEPQQLDFIRQQSRAAGIHSMERLSWQTSEDATTLADWLRDNKKNREDSLVVTAYLNTADRYSQLLEVRGKVVVLVYAGLDELLFEELQSEEKNECFRSVHHPDRNHFFESTPALVQEKKAAPPIVEQLFQLPETSTLGRVFNSNGDPCSTTAFYELEFEDGETETLAAGKTVYWVEGDTELRATVDELYIGATIRYYKNDNPAIFESALRATDHEQQLAAIDRSIRIWRNALKTLHQHFRDLARLHRELFPDPGMLQLQRLKSYLDERSTTRFPGTDVLEAIRTCCVKHHYNSIEFVRKFDEVMRHARMNLVIRQQKGRQLSALLGEQPHRAFLGSTNHQVRQFMTKRIIKNKTLIARADD